MSADNPRGRGPSITQEMKEEIRSLHFQHPDWPAKSFMEPLNEKFGWSPEERAIQKVRKAGIDNLKDKDVQKLLQPWNMAKLDEFPEFQITPEAITAIFKVQEWMDRENRSTNLNVWQVKWISRLYKWNKFNNKPHALWKVATFYAVHELESIFTDKKPDTSKLDEMLYKPIIVGAKWDRFIENWETRMMDYINKKEYLDAEMWMIDPEIFYGTRTWEELKERYSEKGGAK